MEGPGIGLSLEEKELVGRHLIMGSVPNPRWHLHTSTLADWLVEGILPSSHIHLDARSLTVNYRLGYQPLRLQHVHCFYLSAPDSLETYFSSFFSNLLFISHNIPKLLLF